MESIKMSYGGFCFNANPKTVKAELNKVTARENIPFGAGRSREICSAPAVISGSGKFCGENARSQAQMLLSVYKRNGAAYLFSPVLSPVKALFTSLTFSVNAAENCIDYSFVFTEEENRKSGRFDFGYTIAQQGENLFDISNRTATPIENIIALNDFEEPFAVREGDRIWLK